MSLTEWERGKPNWKPARGSATLAREKADKARVDLELETAKLVKARDGWRCRWPEAHKCRGPLEAAHILDKSLGGATSTGNELAVCRWIHRKGPESIHGKQLKVEPETPDGADRALSFHRQTGDFNVLGQPVYYCVAVEDAPGVVRKGDG